MKKEIKDQWVAALRSGNYKQTRSKLHTDEGYCCLGVLCDISKLGRWEESWRGNGEYEYFIDTNNKATAYPPRPVSIHVDLNLVDVDDLAMMNDRGCSFGEIADHIERYISNESGDEGKVGGRSEERQL